MRLLIAAVLAFLLSGIYTPPLAPSVALDGLSLYRDIALKFLFGWMVFEALLGLYQGLRPGPLVRILTAVVIGAVLLNMTAPDAAPLFGWLPAAAQAYRWIGLVLTSLWALVEAVCYYRGVKTGPPSVKAETPPEPAPFKPAAKEELPPYGEVLVMLSLLQEKGRFLDFLTEDITPFNDAQVAAASRVVHQGCSSVLREYFSLAPAHEGKEGQAVTIEKGADPAGYRLVGKIAGDAPYNGKLIHRGWKTSRITLPRSKKAIDPQVDNVITPAEVELK